ncbi:GAF domain-containing protein [Cyanobacteria bacterium FACHB-502]|nr:GAF domain-containing protein [Cyanobacteria bacterium FACHB-502]
MLSRFSRAGLRSQLLLTVLPLALAPVALATFADYLITQNRTEFELTEDLKAKALLSGEVISSGIEDGLGIASVVAKNAFVLSRVRSTSNTAESENLLELSTNELEARLSRTKLIAPSQELNDFLVEMAKAGELAEIIVTDKNGFNVGFNVLPDNLVQSEDEWWKQGRFQQQWISALAFDASVRRYGVNISQRIVDPSNNSFLGVVKVFASNDTFAELATQLDIAGFRGSQQVQLLDTSANSVIAGYSSEGEQIKIFQEQLPLVGEQVISALAARLIEARRLEENLSLNELQQQLQNDFPVQGLVISSRNENDESNDESAQSRSLVASFRYQDKQYAVSTVPRLGWVSIASMDVAEIQGAGRELLNLFAIIALALAAVGTALAIALSRRLAAPLNDLSAKAQQVSAGDLNIRVDPVGSAEARTLALTFNNLVFRVKEFLQEQTLNARRATLAAEITGTELSSAKDMSSLLQKTVTDARDFLGSDRMVIYQFNSDWSGAIVAESVEAGLPSAFLEQLSDPCIPASSREKYLADRILQENDVVEADFHPEHLALLQNLKVRSILGVPIVNQGKLFGLLIAHYCHSIHTWQSSEVDFMKQIGLQLGMVIERVQLLEQTQDLAEEQRQLKEALQRSALQLLIDVDPVSQGDLTVRAKVTEDEIGTVADSYNATIASLRKIVRQVQDAAEQVAETTSTNESAVRTLTTSASEQAKEILAALERVEEMASSVRLVAISAEKAEAAVQEAAQTVQEGDEAMNRTVDGILAIRETVAETAKKVKRLGESSQKISNVVNLISGFAAQTNMLALNASIEASRAGEDGKGFAVVAEEVRSLARQSAEATTEIEKLVASIQAETNEVVRAMEAGTEQVVTGTRLVDDTRQSLNKITSASRQISTLVESIAEATVTQSQASETVTATITTVAQIADQNSTAAGQVSESFEQLRSVAQALQAEVGRFKIR